MKRRLHRLEFALTWARHALEAAAIRRRVRRLEAVVGVARRGRATA